MVRKIVAATASAALCMLSVTPAMAQTYRYSGFDAPQGVTATANLRIPLGREAKSKSKATYGLTLGMGRTGGAGYDGRPISYGAKIADLRFGMDGKMERAQVASFNLANLDDDERLNLTGEGNTLWIVVGLVAAGVAICLLADCFEGDDDSDSSSN
jgi:hypothetical protein